MGPFDNERDNNDNYYVGDANSLPDIWMDQTVLLPDNTDNDNNGLYNN